MGFFSFLKGHMIYLMQSWPKKEIDVPFGYTVLGMK